MGLRQPLLLAVIVLAASAARKVMDLGAGGGGGSRSDGGPQVRAPRDSPRTTPGTFRGRPCPTIRTDKRQVLMLVVGSVRSFVYPTAHEYFHSHQVRAIERRSDAQVHQIWYFSLEDATGSENPLHFPPANLTVLEGLRRRYDVPVFETYDPSSPPVASDFDADPFGRGCRGRRYHLASASYVQAHHFQDAFAIATDYADACGVANWTHAVRTRPDFVCTSPVPLDLSQYDDARVDDGRMGGGPARREGRGRGRFVHDASWKFPIADYFYAMDRVAAEKLLRPSYVDNYFDLPCSATPWRPLLAAGLGRRWNCEAFLKALVVHKGIDLAPVSLNMCALGRRDRIACGSGHHKAGPVTCQNVDRYAADAKALVAEGWS